MHGCVQLTLNTLSWKGEKNHSFIYYVWFTANLLDGLILKEEGEENKDNDTHKNIMQKKYKKKKKRKKEIKEY